MVAPMHPFTLSGYVRRNDALAQRFPLWGRLRVSIPYDRFKNMTPEENFGVWMILNDMCSWNLGGLVNPDGSLAEPPPHLGIKETDFADNDVRCALRIETIEPWLRSLAEDAELDEYGRIRLDRKGMAIVLENYLRIVAEKAKVYMELAKQHEDFTGGEDLETRETALLHQAERFAILDHSYQTALANIPVLTEIATEKTRLMEAALAQPLTPDADPLALKAVIAEAEFAVGAMHRGRKHAAECLERLEVMRRVVAQSTPEPAPPPSAPDAAPVVPAVAPRDGAGLSVPFGVARSDAAAGQTGVVDVWATPEKFVVPSASAAVVPPVVAEPAPRSQVERIEEAIAFTQKRLEEVKAKQAAEIEQHGNALREQVEKSLAQADANFRATQANPKFQPVVVTLPNPVPAAAFAPPAATNAPTPLQRTQHEQLLKKAREVSASLKTETPLTAAPLPGPPPLVQIGLITKPPRPLSEIAPELLVDSKIKTQT